MSFLELTFVYHCVGGAGILACWIEIRFDPLAIARNKRPDESGRGSQAWPRNKELEPFCKPH
jgi:hypothetical protein